MNVRFCLTCAVLALTGCAEPWKLAEKSGSAILPGAKAVPGGHCESSAMMNALLYLGYPVNESMIAGAGGALSFTLQRGTFPFIGARNADMREQFFKAAGIRWHLSAQGVDRAPDAGWAEIDSLLERGIPVVLRVDMRFLPYLYGGKYGSAYMSFGWHLVTLFGIDRTKGIALVSDTGQTVLREIALKDLHKARTSGTKVYPPHGEYYWIEEAPQGYSTDWNALAAHSLDLVIGNYEGGSLAALENYGKDLAEIETYSKQVFLLPAVLEYMAGNIEDFGTGGASFRMLYRDFLLQATAESEYAGLSRALPPLEESIAAWHALSAEFRALAPLVKKMDKGGRLEAWERLRILADDLYRKEFRFYTELKRIRGEA
ncbi:MAG: hypothetical protein A2Z99_13370 [Treponema sp. GWB1_62_6]|nr:MAG: hypothetical protein A2Y36_18640 [Treponema sp. GWA1_62_8]OHE70000.1 MAG: hypothetical protein A2Z99_13370 [Treponema sp. GWB1_62_6]OHE77146.1 MAG: hypothetical protein A2413_16100 [Treponema sp. RIFOXYC1_FULL_61_9]HCM25825.1 hypothetical protein [Treponema sp.]